MKKIVDGVQVFQSNVFSKATFETLVGGQQPLALFITCSDSRIDPNLVTQTQPGELFVIRNAGNIVPAYGHVLGGEVATVEYAVSALRINDIIVCGHSHCGAMTGLLNPDSTETLPAVRAWLSHAESTRRVLAENCGHIVDPESRLMACVETNVLVQLENLRTHPSVASALKRNELQLHGWVYRFETGQVFAYVPGEGEFLPLEHAHTRAAIAS